MTQENKEQLLQLLSQHHALGMAEQIDYEKFYLYSIITHSTAIEGSTVTEVEAQLLFDEGITSSKRSIVEQNMNLDLKHEIEQFQASMQEPAEKGGQKTEKVDRKSGQKTRETVLKLIAENPHITTMQMAASLGINRSALSKHLKRMQLSGEIRHVGPAKGGHWEIKNKRIWQRYSK